MAGYLQYPVNTDPTYWTGRILDLLAQKIPGWTPGGEGTLEVAVSEAVGQVIAELMATVGDVPAAVLRAFGTSLFGVPYRPGTAAQITARVSSTTQGVTIPAGFTVTGTTIDGIAMAFTLPADSKLASNAFSKTVTLTAREIGALGNGVPVGALTIATSTPTILSVVAETLPSSGGSDPETDEEYLNRLTATLGLYNRTAVRAEDFAVLAADVPGVHRALALDLYDPDTGATDAARTVTVVPVDVDGYPVPEDVAQAVSDLLEATREVNFVVKTMEPTYVQLQVAFTATASPGADPATVRAAVIERAYAVLDPGTWAGGDEEPPAWRDDRTVYYLDLAADLDRVEGVSRINSLTINGASEDYTMPGVAVLPAARTSATPTTVTGVVT